MRSPSGSGSDGSRGVQEIARCGGVVLCESPDTAQFNGMPLSAMRTGHVDHVLPPEEIAVALTALGRSGTASPGPGESAETEHGVDAILRLLRDEYAIDFSHYKASTVVRRIERRLRLARADDIGMLKVRSTMRPAKTSAKASNSRTTNSRVPAAAAEMPATSV